MKILFIENRYKTAQWEIIGNYLKSEGHEILWIVQNPVFKPKSGNTEVIPFPKKWKGEKKYTESINKIIKSDRGIKYYGIKNDDYIFYYEKKIREIIERLKPDLVIGESTLFHELLAIEICKEKRIVYLHPSSCRYPINRFSFYLYDSLEPFGKSDSKLTDEEYSIIIRDISGRKTTPAYMKKNEIKIIDKIHDAFLLLFGYIKGERYNTPSPIVKIMNNIALAKNKYIWKKNALNDIRKNKDEEVILYALQMQPEANIDVWGYPNSNQVEVISWILCNLKENQKLFIKPNPKSKFEISNELIKLITKNKDKLFILKHYVAMTEIWEKVDLVFSVTGTISIECILSDKPVLIFKNSVLTEFFPSRKISFNLNQLELQNKINKIKNEIVENEKKIEYLEYIVNTSYSGNIGDGLHNRHHLNQQNQENIQKAFSSVISKIEKLNE